MDDDIPSALRAPELPFRYAIKTDVALCAYAAIARSTVRRGLGVHAGTGESLCPLFFSDSGAELCRIEGGRRGKGRLFLPRHLGPSTGNRMAGAGGQAGSEAIPGAWFEIMGTDRVRHLYRGIPRVRVVHPMPWRDYLAYSGTVKYQVGLAPCFDTEFNRARSHSKLFDITRLGAAGIYSNVTPYREKVVHGQTGYLCANEPDKWVAALTQLLNDNDLRSSIYLKTKGWCKENCSGSSQPI